MAAQVAIGVDVGGTTIKLGVVSSAGEIIERNVLPTEAERGPDAVLERIAEGIRPLLARYTDVLGIGLGVPGVPNERGEISYPPNFPGWEVIAVADRLRPLLSTDLPIIVENDAKAAAYAEARAGGDQSAGSFLFVTLGTGVGGCIIVNGKIWRGGKGGAGEVGHMSVEFNGPQCNCGSRGCVEAYIGHKYMSADATAALEAAPDSLLHAKIAAGNEMSPRLLNECAEQGDSFAQRFLADRGTILGAAFASVLNLCDLHLVIAGGGMAKAEKYLLEPARVSMKSRVLKTISRDVELRPARFGNEAGMIGTALLAIST